MGILGRVARPNPQFSLSGDCVTDNLTGLMWAKNANLPNGTRGWQGALDYVASMNSGSGLCGHHDWRLPNVNELESLLNGDQFNIEIWLNNQGFTNVHPHYYWSSSSCSSCAYVPSYACAWIVWGDVVSSTEGGGVYGYYVWPVRTRQGGSVLIPPSNVFGLQTYSAYGPDPVNTATGNYILRKN